MRFCLAVVMGLAAWAMAPLKAAEVALNDLDVALFSTGWGKPQADKSVSGTPLLIAGEAFAHGVGLHAPSLGLIRLDGKAESFHAKVGINDDAGGGNVEFRIKGDGLPLWSSGPVKEGEKAKEVNIPLEGVRTLELEVDPLGSMDYDHADWAGAVISYSGTKPAMEDPAAPYAPADLYPPVATQASPGNTTYYVNPTTGDDSRPGTSPGGAWKSFARVNALKLAPADRVLIAPGIHPVSLKPTATGTAAKPVVIEFLPGRHEFRSDRAIRLCYYISNSADAPEKPRPIGFVIRDASHLRITGRKGAEIIYGPERMTLFVNEHSEDVVWSGLTFDRDRPTVSEFRVMEAAPDSVVIRPAEGSTYAIKGGVFSWTGDLGPGWTMVQRADPATKACARIGRWDPFANAKAEDIGEGRVRLTYTKGNLGMVPGAQYQFRNIERDTTSALNWRSKDLAFRDCTFHVLPGMGVISQFCENLTFDHCRVAPREGTIRTCPAWADCYHFSGCRGRLLVDSCVFSGCQDDPINIHGTHLRIIEKTAPNQVLVRFMQPQTYGFAAFQPGDKVEFVNHGTLRGYASATVKDITSKTPKDWLLTLEEPVPQFGPNDVVDNVSWYPDVIIRNTTVDTDSCRGFLITTRGKALVEDCTFTRTGMSGILVEDDAEGWFESGPIRDLTIRNNRFLQCAGPVIHINPHTSSSKPEEWVHENIRIEGNYFEGGGIAAASTKGLVITNNRFSGNQVSISAAASCTDVKAEGNTTGAKK